MILPHDGDQLLLGLPGLVELSKQPWGGRSPRALTRGHGRVILKAQAGKSASDFVRAGQGDLFEAVAEERAFVYEGAPLLVRVSARRRQRGR